MALAPGWLLRLAALTAVFAGITWWQSDAVGIGLRDPHGQYFVTRLAISLGLSVLFVVVDAVRRVPRGLCAPRPVLAALTTRWTPARTSAAAATLVCYHVVYVCYHNLKSWDVFQQPRDGLLTRIDESLFLGHSPAVLLHDLLGQGLSAWVLIVVYESFPTLVTVSVVVAVTMVDRLRDGAVFVASMCWAWVLGTASYYAIPSLGPFHERPQDFADLPVSIVTRTQATYLAQRSHLLAAPGAHDAFAQISAFASLHVAITAVIVLTVAWYGWRRTAVVLTGFLAATVIATVYLGWHFAVDDVAGLLIAGAAVVLGRLTIYPRGVSWSSDRSPSCPSTLTRTTRLS